MTNKDKLVQMVGNENATKWIDTVKSMVESDATVSMDDNKIATPVLTEMQS